MPFYPLDLAQGRIVLPAKITGPKGPQAIDVILDTGASITTLSHEMALAIGCSPTKASHRIEIMTASSVELVPIVVIPTIEVLGHKVKCLEVVCHDLPSISPVDGLLGLNFLKHFNLHLNFLTHSLDLFR